MLESILKKVGRFSGIAARERLQSPQIIQSTAAVRHPQAAVSELVLFQVQDSAGYGVYKCYRQTTFGNYAAPETDVLHLAESLVSGTPALVPGDILAAWQTPDTDGTMRWVGFLMGQSVKMAITKASAGYGDGILCNLLDKNGDEITSGLGSWVGVSFKMCNETNINACEPRFSNGEYLFATNIYGVFYYHATLQASENKECE